MFYCAVILALIHLTAILRRIDDRSLITLDEIKITSRQLLGSKDCPRWLHSRILEYEIAGESHLDEMVILEGFVEKEIGLRRKSILMIAGHWGHLIIINILMDTIGVRSGIATTSVVIGYYILLLVLSKKIGSRDICIDLTSKGVLKGLKSYQLEINLNQRYGKIFGAARISATICEMMTFAIGISEFWSNYREVWK